VPWVLVGGTGQPTGPFRRPPLPRVARGGHRAGRCWNQGWQPGEESEGLSMGCLLMRPRVGCLRGGDPCGEREIPGAGVGSAAGVVTGGPMGLAGAVP